jgi:hypothetical protein
MSGREQPGTGSGYGRGGKTDAASAYENQAELRTRVRIVIPIL